MMKNFYLTISNVRMNFTVESQTFFDTIQKRYSKFLGKASSADWEINTNIVGRNFFKTQPAQPFIDFYDTGRFISRGNGFSASGDISEKKISLFLVKSLIPFDGFLRVFLSLALLEKEGFLLHSAAIDVNGRGYLCPGGSESGKTTLCKKVTENFAIGDELVGVYFDKGKHWIASTPFWGNFKKGKVNKTVPLNAIYFLNKRLKKTGIVPLTASQSINRIFKLALCYVNNSEYVKKLLSRIIATAISAENYQFKFDPKESSGRILNQLR